MSINNFASIQVRLASPETILKWSHGEVTKPETINYRSQKAERDGLFCERIFGPTKDWECACGKYKKVRFKGVVCDRCGVEITKASVRRERMGHIHLAAPVAHIWYLRGIPSRMALLLDVTPKQLEEVVYFVSYIVTDPKDTDLGYKQILSEREYRENMAIYGAGSFTAQTGAEAVLRLLQDVDLEQEYADVQEALEKAQGEKRKKLIKRLDTINAFRKSDNKPEWMILTNIPVIPPDLRPMLQLDGGRFATSDLNDLYRRVITRNNRLRKLLELGTPNIIVQNEKRMLQEAVDALIDNGRRSKPITGAGGRALKSLSHSLKGKQGRFRQNLLGKRVDFSGRSVIAVGPDLKMYQCGIPREMAINLFKPFIINEIVNQQLAANPKNAEKLIERRDPRIWDVVEKVIDGYPVLMNRAPTLHRLGIQAFLPKLVEGRAMRLHPLVCTAFNADFDGDQMAIHVPLSEEARAEALVMMLGSHNILGPKDGKPIVTPGQDMVMGNFYLTMEETKQELLEESQRYMDADCPKEAAAWKRYALNEGHVYSDVDEVMLAYQTGQIHLHSRIALPVKGMNKTSFNPVHENDYLITTVGKIIFNDMFPADFPYLNEVSKENFEETPARYFVKPGEDIKAYIEQLPIVDAVKKKDLGKVIAEVFKRYSVDETAEILDQIKAKGFKYSTVAGITVSLSDIEVAPNKWEHVDEGREKADQLKRLQRKGMLTMEEWERHLNKLWADVKDDIVGELMANLPRKNPINMMATSGARGNTSNFTQLAGMRGLMAKPGSGKGRSGEYVPSIIEVPIYSCFREGLNVSEFFISTHGVRKGLTDTALKTAESGYLTRRLVDVAQDVIVKEDDCGTDKGYWVETLMDRKTNTVIEPLMDRLVGRYSKQDVTDPNTGELIIASDEFITDEIAKRIVDAGIEGMYIRSAFTCKSRHGVCRKCYGRNMATGKDVEVGEAIGIMAAQSIGEPGTQLTMRTFHTGGVAGGDGGDITQGLPRVEELFEARCPKGVAVIAQITGEITSIERIEGTMRQEVIVTNANESVSHKINANQTLRPWVQVGATIQAGVAMTEGPLDPKELLRVAGVREVQDYILKEVKKVYQSQGIEISDKHIEVMIKQMLKKVIVVDSGDTDLNVGVQLSLNNITKINREALLSGKTPAQFKPVLLGISKASVETDSFLSAASFQETTKVLTDATIKGKVDNLIGLKENVIIGKLIPAGTGCEGDRPQNAIVMAKAKELRDKRIARMHEVQDEEFDNIVNENLTEELPKMDEEPSLDQDGIINDSDVLDNQSIEINE
ncbi:DNA-directed RNA polymerase subunit beta' [Faecalitalea cylindroides]|uniref:DNA-directed RNA polymerase subunit beta' n=1 Tax=Faecalitalea cylindroides TaxID=39483 RepID=UPI00232E151A|nr:DNA-directed RNA polymerase subunit beta' [Faecalitalea cylindroides]MDB7951923.1 DNA-directed RNA polymerase subunit beta' [Faecalitalea cylindroides]MDB7958677.1 DNA-directed RNA polymerase subunit beta' [Faecalitalea cylindroides]MDB7960606.1 DNA-directed RNA polymerase subunit beta' [Faecalitalea cylindroides]MDB7962511.1 DNA-directed RNA polymerase subunit beta' [Faecalitalea cylindroides]MDB7964432.1 DNA-directed RNA polymerase subunit beta' [Faecalitalea cylindroides]